MIIFDIIIQIANKNLICELILLLRRKKNYNTPMSDDCENNKFYNFISRKKPDKKGAIEIGSENMEHPC
jgi:hypothetical protein